MNRIARLATAALSIAAAGTAFAESPDAAGAQVVLAQPAAVQVPSAVIATGVVGEAQLQRAEAVASTRTRAEVRAETLAALARGELPRVATDIDTLAAAAGGAGPIAARQLATIAR